jgi:hypothetical protein
MDHEFHSIVEKLAILEGRIAPRDNVIAETNTKQKKPALFNNLKKEKKTDEDVCPMVGGVEFAEEKSQDVLSQVKASLADYLKSAEENIKQDRDLIAKKKQDLDLKKKELKDLELQSKKEEVEEAIPMTLEEGPKLEAGDPVEIVGNVEYSGATGEIVDFGQRSNFIIVNLYNHGTHSFNAANVKYNEYANDEDADEYGEYEDDELAEEPNQTPAQGEAASTESDPTYAQGSNSTYAESAPVKTVDVPLEEMGGSVLVEIHGDERNGFCIKRAGKEMATRFKSLAEAELALEMYNAHRAKMMAANKSADYIEEK